MSVIITIGINIIMLGIGIFVGKRLTHNSPNNNNDGKQSMFKNWINNIKQNISEKKAEKQMRAKLKKQARMEAFKQMQPELVKHMIEQERKKITGEDKKEKLKKLANAFSMSGTGFNSEQQLNNMLGGQKPVQQHVQKPIRRRINKINKTTTRRPVGRPRQQTIQQPVQQNDSFAMNKLNKMIGGQDYHNNNINFNTQNTFSDDKINMMLGKNNKKSKKEMSDEEKLKRLLS